MARKRRSGRKHAGRTRKKQARHAKHFDIEQGAQDFGEEMGALGRKFGKEMEEITESRGMMLKTTVGFVLYSVLSIVALLLLIGVLGIVNASMKSITLGYIHAFLMANMGLLILLCILAAFTNRFERWSLKASSVIIIPLVAVSRTAAVWLIANIIRIVNIESNVPEISQIMGTVLGHLDLFFLLFLLLGVIEYGRRTYWRRNVVMERSRKGKIRRLYRSGNDRILGGVCGGIAEYLGIDPTIVRLLWVLAVLLGGSGVLLYIICWIIIPRNPKHKWK